MTVLDKNGSPPKSKEMTAFEAINKRLIDSKYEAIAFANWILKHDAYPITDDQWLVARGEDPVTKEGVYTYSTTEELYNEFLKVVQ